MSGATRRFGQPGLRFRTTYPGRWHIDVWEPIGAPDATWAPGQLGTWRKTGAYIERRTTGHYRRDAGWYFVLSGNDNDSPGRRVGWLAEDAAWEVAEHFGVTPAGHEYREVPAPASWGPGIGLGDVWVSCSCGWVQPDPGPLTPEGRRQLWRRHLP